MTKEVLDPHSGAILFKPDEDTEKLSSEIHELKKLIFQLEKRVKTLERK